LIGKKINQTFFIATFPPLNAFIYLEAITNPNGGQCETKLQPDILAWHMDGFMAGGASAG